ncbi:MAG TPA: DUF2092 domain-containing protein [Geobacteraceae bacterium]|nr:DUF2092 domain-containing protein [Geobacteraceae bacterium]
MINIRSIGRVLFLSLALCLLVAPAGSADEVKKPAKKSKSAKAQQKETLPAAQMILEPKAIDILKAASSRLAAARTLSFTAVATHENMSRLGYPLLNTVKGEVVVQRPDKMRVITPGDGRAFEFYYDGKKIMAYAPVENLVAVADAPPTIEGMLAEAHRLAAISFPFADMLADDPFKKLEPRLKVAFYVGQSQVVGGTTTDIVAIGNDAAFAQLWIGTDDHLPRMIRVMYHDDPAALRFQVEYSNWVLDREFPPGTFASAKAESAPRIPFDRPDLERMPAQDTKTGKGKTGKSK